MPSTERYNTRDVFTPTTPARLTFVERESINNKLVNALRTPGKQIVVYGHSGSGKTTLLENKLYQTYEQHITSRCVKGLTFEQLILDAFDQLGGFYEAERVKTNKSSVSSSVSAEYAGIKAQVSSQLDEDQQRKAQRLLPPQLTPQTLARLLGEANCCWVLEDFHKVEGVEKVKLAQVMKVFMDMADQYRDLKIIALGAVNTARQVVEADAEMRNRVSEIYVPLMSDDEINEIIGKGELLLNFSLPQGIRDGIVRYSNGLASVCHQLCLNICFSAGINGTLSHHVVVEEHILKDALEDYLQDASDTLKSAFDRAFRIKRSRKYDNGKLILEALIESNQDGATSNEILARIRKKAFDYPPVNVTYYLKELQTEERGAVLRYDASSGRFSFSDPIYRAFAMTLFEKDQPSRSTDYDMNTFTFDMEAASNVALNVLEIFRKVNKKSSE